MFISATVGLLVTLSILGASLHVVMFSLFPLQCKGMIQSTNYQATKWHFEDLSQQYGNPIIGLNLINVHDFLHSISTFPSDARILKLVKVVGHEKVKFVFITHLW